MKTKELSVRLENHGFCICKEADKGCDASKDGSRFNEYCSQDFTKCKIYQAKLQADLLSLQRLY